MLSLEVALLLEEVLVKTFDLGVLLSDLLERLVETSVEFPLLLSERLELR
jgi:hypothetical protein